MARYRNVRKHVRSINFIHIIQSRQGLQIACLQEIAWKNQWMTTEQVLNSIKDMKNRIWTVFNPFNFIEGVL